MTIFSDNPYDRRMERLMMTIPNFAPRGVGFRFTEAQLFITATAATPSELLTTTMRQIRCPPFRKRFNEYIEREENPMTYINEKHRTRFTLAAKNVHRENYALLSALYLLTADQRLWSCCKHHINNGCVFFENIKLHNCTERAYTLYCAAKDLTLGTKHLTVSDLSDADLHAEIREYLERHEGVTMAEFITLAVGDELHPKIQQKEGNNMGNMRTMAFQVPEELFQRIKDYLHRNNMSQKEFVLGLIKTELDREQAEREHQIDTESPTEDTCEETDEEVAENGFAGECEGDNSSDEETDTETEDEDESEGFGMTM